MNSSVTRIVTCLVAAAMFAGCASTPGEGTEAPVQEAPVAETPAMEAPEHGPIPEPIPGPEHPLLVDQREFSTGVYGGSLAVLLGQGDGAAPISFNPATSFWDKSETTINRLLFSSLIERDPLTGRYVPRLAESFELRNNDRTIRITLREGLVWSDGRPLTVDDVVYSFTSVYLDPDLCISGALATSNVGAIEVTRTGSRTLEITIERRHPSIWRFVTLPPLPKHVLEPWLTTNEKSEFLDLWSVYDTSILDTHTGSGPYVLAEHLADQSVRLERNPHYFDVDSAGNPLPYLDELTFMIPNGTEPEELYLSGSIDLVRIAGPIGAQTVADTRIDDEHYVAVSAFSGGVNGSRLFLDLNLSIPTDANPFGSTSPVPTWFRVDAFRLALGHLIDREAINTAAFGGAGAELWTGEPVESPYAPEAAGVKPEHDVTRANQILDELGWLDTNGDGIREDTNGNPLRLEISTDLIPVRELIAGLLASQFAQGGIDVHVDIQDHDTQVGRILGAGNYDAFLLAVPWDLEEAVEGGYRDFTGFSRQNYNLPNPTLGLLNTVTDRMLDTVDPDAYIRLVRLAESILCLQGDTNFIVQAPQYWALRKPYGNLLPRVGDVQMLNYDRVYVPEEYR